MDWTLIYIVASLLILPVLIYGAIAQSNVNATFHKFSNKLSSSGKSAAIYAQQLLVKAGVLNVKVVPINGRLTDCYDPKRKVVKLSDATYTSTSIAAIGVATHEVGHAIQDAKGSFLFKLRIALVPICNFISYAYIPLIFVGSILSFTFYIETVGYYICLASIVMYGASLLFQLVTLPLERDASNKALKLLSESGDFSDTELAQAKKVLNAAIQTYIAGTLTSLVYFLRFLSYAMIFTRRRD